MYLGYIQHVCVSVPYPDYANITGLFLARQRLHFPRALSGPQRFTRAGKGGRNEGYNPKLQPPNSLTVTALRRDYDYQVGVGGVLHTTCID